MKLLTIDQQQLLERLDNLGLASSVLRDFSSLLPFIYNEQWHTSISLRRVMRIENSYTRKELSRVSSALSNTYHNSALLKRQEKRKLYFRYWHTRHISHWAYQLDWEYLTKIMPLEGSEEYQKQRAQYIFDLSLE